MGGEGTTGSPSYTKIVSEDGTEAYIFAANDGSLRISATEPTSNSSGSALASVIGSGAVLLANLAAAISPSHIAKYAGKATWSGGGATKALTVTGVAATDIVMATIQTKPTEAGYLVGVVPTTNTITFELSAANTTNDAVISYVVFRATS
jgi:hypothetical protein